MKIEAENLNEAETPQLNIGAIRSSNYMMIDVDWIDSSIQNYIELRQNINKDGNDPIMTQDYNAKIRILKEVKKQTIKNARFNLKK